MTRDDDFMRKLLLEAEESDRPHLFAGITLSPTKEDLTRYAHAQWLADAGLFKELKPDVYRITNQGHDFLAATRRNDIWDRTKATAAGVGGVTLGLMKDIALAYLKQELTDRLGLPLG